MAEIGRLRVSYDSVKSATDMIHWLVEADTLELRDLALNLLADVETLKRQLAGVRTGEGHRDGE